MRTLIATVGYRHLGDLSIGPNLFSDLRAFAWEPGVEVEDLSYGPIAVVQNLEDRPLYDRMIFVAAARRGRPAGRIYKYVWPRAGRSGEEVQARIAEAVTGVIDLDNLLVIAEHFRVLALDVVVFEVEPVKIESGEDYSAPVQSLAPKILEMVRAEACGRAHSTTR